MRSFAIQNSSRRTNVCFCCTNKNKCDIYFPEYNWTAKSVNTSVFNSGGIACPYEPRTLGVGYLGEGPYQTRTKEMKPGERTKEYIKFLQSNKEEIKFN